MKVLIIGSGGREHAIAWKLAQSEQVEKVFVAPGNAGTAAENKVFNVDIDVLEFGKLIEFAKEYSIDLTVVGPEAPLVEGMVDEFTEAGLLCFGPTQLAARLEGSKSFTKDFLKRHHIPTAAYQSFTEVEPALAYLEQHRFPIVIKADGLAAGKGVVIAQNYDEATSAVKAMLSGNRFGAAGAKVVIEEFLQGEEASFIVVAHDLDFVTFASSQDHKARDNGDVGPNTGGMGAYSPAPVVTSEIEQQVIEQIIKPTLQGLKDEGYPYSGFLYAGLMIDQTGQARVLEFNCRLGDPETQPLMMRLKSDLAALFMSALTGKLNEACVDWYEQAALGVVLAAGGYPDSYQKGKTITGLDEITDCDVKVFHAGTLYDQAHWVTNGGRVLCVTALADSILAAQQKAYASVEKIKWDDMYYRTDIGFKAIRTHQ